MRTILLYAVFFTVGLSYKYLVYSPLFAHSHVNFIGRLADTLTDAGHDVTVFLPVLDVNLTKKTGLKTTKKTIFLHVDPRVDQIMKTTTIFSNVWTMQNSPLGMLGMIDTMSEIFGYACEHQINQKDILEQLRKEKFDAAIVEPFQFCGFGIMEQLGIKTVLAAFSGTNLELISHYIGEPSAFSYVPTVSGPGEKMTVGQKLGNLIGGFVGFYMFNTIGNSEGKVMQAKWGETYSGHGALVGRSSFSFINANPYIDFPRPIIAKTVYLGGIAVDVSNVEKVDYEWDAVLSERSQTVLISFGSIAKSKDMPENYKKEILKVVASLSNTTFIWKYEEPTELGKDLPNLYFSKWVPQKPLLADERLTLFITHGGLGSTTEVAYLGKPAIFIPLFADQPRNAIMLTRHSTAVILKKEDLSSYETIKNAIGTILNDKSYIERAKLLGKMLRNQPDSPKEKFIQHAQFAASFGPINSLNPYGKHLSFAEYYLLDVLVFVGGILMVVIVGIAILLKWCCCSSKKQKKE